MSRTIIAMITAFSLLSFFLVVVNPCFADEDIEKKIEDLTKGVKNIGLALAILAIIVAGIARYFGKTQIMWWAISGTAIILLGTAIFAFLKKYLG